MKTLNEAYNGGSIAEYWGNDSQYPLPWIAFEQIPAISTAYIDNLIFSEYGERPISPFVKRHLNSEGVIDTTAAVYISRYVFAILYKQFERYCAAYAAEYNPAENYNMRETSLDTHRNSGTDTTTTTYTDYKETSKFGHTVETESNDNIYGFDNDDSTNPDGVKANKGTTATHYKQDTGETGDTKEIEGAHSDALQHGHIETIEHSFTRAGNIGVQTAPEMIEKDFRLWGTNNLWFKIAADVAEVLTIPIYE